jgi:transcriptional regulator with XRE-family HTH domain
MDVNFADMVNNVDIRSGCPTVSVTQEGQVAIDQQALYARIGKSIRRARENQGLTQAALAALVGLKRTSITNVERGMQKLLLHTFIDLAHALHISPTELLGDVGGGRGEAKEWDELLKGRPRIEQEWLRSALDASRKAR